MEPMMPAMPMPDQAGTGMQATPEAAQEKVVPREPPEVSAARKALVTVWAKKITDAKEDRKDTFKCMRDDATFAAGKQWPGQTAQDDRYRANITLRHINQRVASIYAKNPKVRARRRQKIYLKTWDGSPEQLAQARAAVMLAANPMAAEIVAAQGIQAPVMDPRLAEEILREAEEARTQKKLYERMGRTLELVAQWSMDEPIPKFKDQAKQLVRRVLTCKVGFLKLGYQRIMKYGPDTDARIKDLTDRLKHIELLAADVHDGEVERDSARAEELRLQIDGLQRQREVVLREGLMFSFPRAWSIIVPKDCTQLKGFVAAPWIAEEYVFTPDQVQKIYNIDPKNQFDAHTAEGVKGASDKDKTWCAVYEVYNLEGQECFTILLGYPDFLKAPGEPDIATEQFHPYYTLSFNDTENPEDIYPPSDVELMRPMQVDYNRAREGMRVHRVANRPAHVTAQGVFDDDTKTKLGEHADHEIIETNLSKNEDIKKALQPKPTNPIQPELYDVEHTFVDTQRVAGDQAANLGGTSGDTATEVTVAENSRTTSLQSSIDELDEFLTGVMRGAGQVLLMNMGKDQVVKIAGPAAAWPDVPATRQEVSEELMLEIRAGSSGRPNKVARLVAIEKTGPLLMQIPGVKPRRLGEFMLAELDEGIELDEFMDESLPSITAMNAMAKPNVAPGPGNEAQGPQGKANAERPLESGAKVQNLGGRPSMVRPSGPLGAV